MSDTPKVGKTVVVHDRGRPQAGRDVHPALITNVISEKDGVISVRVLPENGVDYPIKALNYMHGKNYVEGLGWRWPDDDNVVQTDDGEAKSPDPQETPTPTPGVHEPRNVAGAPVAKPGEAPNEDVGERSDVKGEGSEKAKADAEAEAAAAAAKKDGDDEFADLETTDKKSAAKAPAKK